MLYLISTIMAHPGQRDAVVAAAQPCIAGTRAEAGNIAYDLHQSATDPDKLVFVEKWRDRAALEAHFHEPHLKAWREAGVPLIASRAIEIIEPANVETIGGIPVR